MTHGTPDSRALTAAALPLVNAKMPLVASCQLWFRATCT
eukprot:CAMPEP_0168373242 /NCGR_PEP_ID=MMETSP0228-20121227/8688_1 /TAXON_ID=133427 /ORGANISM="Protoceratium reticulatum, Strain CCCM 535 (=CCMP 1889)" /LENGTH=38 /DNA_ID= /DNA_START= /DNA_END= /DNA_ORIENTATION=